MVHEHERLCPSFFNYPYPPHGRVGAILDESVKIRSSAMFICTGIRGVGPRCDQSSPTISPRVVIEPITYKSKYIVVSESLHDVRARNFCPQS